MISGNMQYSTKHKRYRVVISNDGKVVFKQDFKVFNQASDVMTNEITNRNEIERLKHIDPFKNYAYLSQVKRGIYG